MFMNAAEVKKGRSGCSTALPRCKPVEGGYATLAQERRQVEIPPNIQPPNIQLD
jgi:hypothetical protein